jgi:CDP-diacylglycerol--glycerol-3-phosphate 3-phosphatidyltransferase
MDQVLTIPNLLTLLRLAALPVVLALSRTGHPVAASAVFVAAMLTDPLDGWIAVRFHQQSRIGLYLDPVVDKVVILAMLYELSLAGLLDAAIPHLFLARELLQNGIRSYAASLGSVVGANWMGKTKAVLQTILIAWGLLLPWLTAGRGEAFASTLQSAFQLSAWLVLVLAWVFFFVFLRWNRHHFRSAEPST